MTAFINCYTRRIQVTSNIILRSIIFRNSSNDVRHLCTNNKPDFSSRNQNNSDYFGIDSENGVITIESQKHPSFETSGKRSLKEKFHNTAFGVVRYDSENKLKYHGQYNSRRDFLFPYKSTDIAEVQKDILASTTDDNENQLEEELNVLPSRERMINDNNIDILNEKDEEVSYIDEHYFGTSVINSSTVDDAKRSELKDLNFIDQEYFKTLDDSYSTFGDIRDFSGKIMRDEVKDSLKEEEIYHSSPTYESAANDLNFLEQNYFKNFTSSESETSIDKTAPVRSNDFSEVSPDERNLLSTERKHSTISKHSDGTASSLQESTCFDRNNLEKLINREDMSELDKLSSIVNEYNLSSTDINNTSKNLSDSQNIHIQDSTPSFETINVNISKNTLPEKPNTEDFLKSLQNNNIHDYDFNEGVSTHISKTNFKYPMSSRKIKNNVTKTKDVFQSVAADTEISGEGHVKTIKPFSKENNDELSGSIHTESEQGSVQTAHDFVQDLRKEQKNSLPNLAKRKVISEEKSDSKGFRILKNQVQDLSSFTQAEILHILKQNIVYSDENLLVLNKPYSLIIHESETTKNPCLSMVLDELAKEMDKNTPNPKLFTVHRLDKETTGCLLLARNETMAQNLKYLFAERKIIKKYWIITTRVPDPTEGIIDIPITEGSINNRKRMVLRPNLPKDLPYQNHARGGKPAITSYKVLSESGNAALVEATPVTGVKHQIRVHFGFGLGCPILGDHKYSHLDKLAPQKLPSDILQKLHVRQSKVRYIPMHIHAKSVIIPSYFERRDLIVHIPLPDHMKVNLKRLKFKKRNML